MPTSKPGASSSRRTASTAVVSTSSGVFKPYAGVSTAILFFTKGAKTERIWFYGMEHDGFSLDGSVLMHRLPVGVTKVPLCHGQDIKSIR